jgi:hypothetical protein
MRDDHIRYDLAIGACALFCAHTIGCLSVDTAPRVPDAGVLDAGLPGFDAGGAIDGAVPPAVDAGSDALMPIDSGAPSDATPPVEAGYDAAAVSQLGLVAGGAISRSGGYMMTATTGPATAPVLRSSRYQLVVGMSVSARKP